MSTEPTLVLFTGLAADERLLEPQRALPCQVVAPGWVEPEDGETLPQYARRVAAALRWPERFIVGGVSFGGMLAAELSLLLRPLGVVLIASALSSRAVPTLYRFVNALGKAVPDPAVRFGSVVTRPLINMFRGIGDEDSQIMMEMIQQTPVPRLRRTADMALKWEGVAELPCPRLWIHGENDLILPIRKLRPHQPDVVIPGAGHLVNWTHAGETNAAIGEFVNLVAG